MPLARAAEARKFYFEALGCVEDQRVAAMGKEGRLLWANLGAQQFHLPLCCDGPQIIRGTIGLVTKSSCASFDMISAAGMQPKRVPDTVFPSSEAIRIADPFGNEFLIHERPEAPSAGGPVCIGAPPTCKGQPGGSDSLLLGILYVQMFIPRGAADAIAHFWGKGIMGGYVTTTGRDDDGSLGLRSVRVDIGPADSAADPAVLRQWLQFDETDDASLTPPWDGHHIALYLHNFETAFREAEARGLLYDPGRFTDRGGSWELACEFQQFRTVHVPRTGEGLNFGLLQVVSGAEEDKRPVYSLELEIRALGHPSCPL